MLSSLLRAALLAGLVVAIAQAGLVGPPSRHRAPVVLVTSSRRPGVAAVVAAAAVAAGDAHPRSDATALGGDAVAKSGPTSVVQDWSLVCQQLCGAGLGGEPCAPYCADLELPTPEEQAANADAILDPNRGLVCEDLCRLQLGEVNCLCDAEANGVGDGDDDDDGDGGAGDVAEAAAVSLTTASEMDEVCGTFCTNNGATLAGCTLCTFDEALAAETTTTSTSTTPDWNELCVTLCKTGDGGSLCNCDLSPFF